MVDRQPLAFGGAWKQGGARAAPRARAPGGPRAQSRAKGRGDLWLWLHRRQ
jgi:hypothetical protein